MSTIKIKAPAMPDPKGVFKPQSKPLTYAYTEEQLAARDAQWLEMAGPVVEALKDIAASIYMDDSGQLRLTRSFDESVITEALSAITKD